MQALPQNRIRFPNFPFTDRQNNVGQLTLPNSYYPSYLLNIGNFDIEDVPINTTPNIVDNDIKSVNANWLSCMYYGYGCPTPDGTITGGGVSGIVDSFSVVIKNYLLLFFAFCLILLGIYMMAKSTDEGKILLRAAGA